MGSAQKGLTRSQNGLARIDWPEWIDIKKGRKLQQVCRSMLAFLESVDEKQIFATPVDTDEVEGYAQLINEPMDFSTMSAKIERSSGSTRSSSHGSCYTCLAEFRRDLCLVITNCLSFNEDDSIFTAEALKLASSVQDAYEAATSHITKHSNGDRNRRCGGKHTNVAQLNAGDNDDDDDDDNYYDVKEDVNDDDDDSDDNDDNDEDDDDEEEDDDEDEEGEDENDGDEEEENERRYSARRVQRSHR